MEEIWKDIIWYEWLYQVSNLGNIKSLERYKNYNTHIVYNKERILKFNTSNWYSKVTLYKWKLRKHILVHRLVAIHFILDINIKLEVNHIDWNKQNNRVENLEWCTRSENQIHCFKNWLQKQIKWSDNFKIKISQYYNNTFIKTYNSILQASKETWICESSIRKVLYWRQKTAWWYNWKKFI